MEISFKILEEWAEECNCCPICDQQIPCDDVMAGGVCQEWCECEEREEYYEEEEEA